MKKIYTSFVFLVFHLQATVEEALFDWLNTRVDTYTERAPAYKEGYGIGYKIGNTMSKDDAVTYLTSWVYFRGFRENQRHCTLDETWNGIIESVLKSTIQSAIAQNFKTQFEGFVQQQALGAGASIRSMISPYRLLNYLRSWLPEYKKEETPQTSR